MSDALGLLLLAVYIVAVVGLAAVITFAVIKIFPTERKPKDPDGSDDSKQNRGSESQAGNLFRRSKRAAT